MISLRPYQREAIDAVHRAEEQGVRRPAIGLPTGTGKTIVFSALAEERAHRGRALILAHRDELLTQAADKYREVNLGADVGFVRAGLADHDHDVVVASVQTLCQPKRLAAFPFPLFKTAIIDEAHHAVAPTYMRIIDALDPDCLLVGVSATLERGDKVGLGAVWEEVVYLKTLQEMIAAGYLVDIRAKRVKLNFNMGSLRSSHGDFVASDVGEMLEATGAYSAAASAYLEHASDRAALVFTPTIESAKIMAATFRQAGVPSESVDGEMPLDERRAVLARLKSGETRMVSNAMVLTEGFDEPSVGCVIVARPTKSRPLYVQMVGRGTRLYPGKDDLLVLDLVGNDERLDLVSLPRLFGLSPEALDQDGRGAVEYVRAEGINGLYDPSLGFSAEEVDLFDRKDINWQKLPDGRWILSVGVLGQLSLVQHEGRWAAGLVAKNGSKTTLGKGLDIGYAMGIAEEFLREKAPGAMKLADKTAPWRQRPATQKQIALLKNLGVAEDPDMTSGHAADIITALFAARRVA